MSETFTNYYPVKINVFEIKRVWKHKEHGLFFFFLMNLFGMFSVEFKDSPGQTHTVTVYCSAVQ